MKKNHLVVTALLAGITALFLWAAPAQAAVDSTPDCDTVAIIRCGVSSPADLRNKVQSGDIPRVFDAFGISRSELNGLQEGVVWKDGRVTIGRDRVVATNAVTAGRWNNPTGDMRRIANTDRAYKMSTSHFVDEGQIAYIKMVDGKFKFAVIRTCGNPVTATPVKQEPPAKPALTIAKEVKTGGGNWQESVTVKPGDQVRYRVVITNSGNVTLKKLTLQDVLPTGITQAMVTGGMQLNGAGIGNDITKRLALPDLKPGDKHVITYAAVTSSTETRPEACKQGLVNKAYVRTDGILPERYDSATVKVCSTSVPTPVYACRYMNLRDIDRAKRIVETDTAQSADKDGATFLHYLYDFGDGTPVMTSTDATQQHTYAQDGTYTVKVSVVYAVNGVNQPPVTGENCQKTVTFSPTTLPPTPPTTPTVLPDTGAGAIAGAFVSTIAGGMMAYRLVWLRRIGE
jgi:uncharacterized repeat protein (TIGR01451 family)